MSTLDELRSPCAIRERCAELLTLAERDALGHFELCPERIPAVAELVAEEIRTNYPDLEVPLHSRWRHLAAGGLDRWNLVGSRLGHCDEGERARIRFDLVVTSVLLDAGAGHRWSYREARTGQSLSRSEGLAVASFDLFTAGAFSGDPRQPLRADATALAGLDSATLAAALQVGPENPLAGLEGRTRILRRVGDALLAHPRIFGGAGARRGGGARIGHLYDYLRAHAPQGSLDASFILRTLLDAFADIWPGRIRLAGHNLGDVWEHHAIRRDDETDRLIPFHKLSQWLAYSLVEPLEEAGIRVVGLERLTGLAEYRNGGLMLDGGILRARDAESTRRRHRVDDEIIVEWRALTVALLDRLAPLIRDRLALGTDAMPLGRILEGGTWAAGRRLARERRPDGRPPLCIASDGTVF